ncbi:hypothetical protein BJ165DRAFT_1524872 [Panaeolus papilionaceus]|nr:hypothetical protein BJ165DRAFT_1524872 [Panaeolus papilionaceus]
MVNERTFTAAQSLLAWQICLTIFHAIAIGFTLTRLVHRWRTRKIWWDDYIVLLPLVTDIVYVVVNWIMRYNNSFSQDGGQYRSFIFSKWFVLFMFFTVVWISRICLALSFARIFDPGHACRRFGFCLVVAFASIYLTLVFVNTFTCRLGATWYKSKKCKEVSDRSLGYVIHIIFDFSSDFLLIVSPLAMLRKMKLTPKERALIMCLFSSSIFSLLFSVIVAITWYIAPDDDSRSQVLMSMTTLLQVASCLLVCNLFILTRLFCKTFMKKKVERDEDDEETATSQFTWDSSPPLSPPQRARTFWRDRNSNSDVGSHTSRSPSSRYTPITLTSIYEDSVWSSFSSSIRSWMSKSASIPSTHDLNSVATSVPSWNFTIRSGSERSDPEAGSAWSGGRSNVDISKSARAS